MDDHRPPQSFIQHSVQVPVVQHKKRATVLTVVSAVLSGVGIFPWVMLLTTLQNGLRFMEHTGAWVLVSGFLFAGLVIALSQLKHRSYQSKQEHIIGWSLVGFSVLMMALPVVAAALYGAGVGD